MKSTTLALLCSLVCSLTFGQQSNVLPTDSHYFKIIPGSDQSRFNRAELSSDVDSTWARWKERGVSFGFNPKLTPMYTNINGIISTPYMIQVRGNEFERNKKRWGYHVFEGYATDDKSRITMLLNKHVEEALPVAELYYYGTAYNHSEQAYNWFKIGSDVRQHSFMFGRDKALFYGSLKLSNALTLGNVSRKNLRTEKPQGDDEKVYEEDAKFVNFKELKGSGNGTLFYDEDHNIVVIKINGKWMKLGIEALPKGVEYPF
jgi:hypothetical protein